MTQRHRRISSLVFLLATAFVLLATPTTSSAATAPAAPSGLTATYVTGSMNLSWVDNATDETGFAVERCLVADCSSAGQIATVGANVTAFADAFYASGTDNVYRVRAFNLAGSSAGSNIAAFGLLSTGDVHPVALATPISGQAPLTVAFDASGSTALNGTITSWLWSFGDNEAGSGVTTSHTFTTPGVYATRVKVGVTGGFGNPSNSTAVLITVTAPPPVPLAVATNLAATSPARSRVNLTWANPATSATSLTVQRCKGATCTAFTRIATVPLTATTYLDTTGTRGTTYSYRLAASNATGTVYSNRATVTVRR